MNDNQFQKYFLTKFNILIDTYNMENENLNNKLIPFQTNYVYDKLVCTDFNLYPWCEPIYKKIKYLYLKDCFIKNKEYKDVKKFKDCKWIEHINKVIENEDKIQIKNCNKMSFMLKNLKIIN